MSLNTEESITIPPVPTVVTPMKDEDSLNYTQNIRKRVVEDLIQGGKMPSDPKDRAQLLATLDGMDRQVLTKQKIKIEEKSADADRLAAEVMAAIVAQTRGRSPFERPVIEGQVVQPRLGAPVLDTSKIPKFEPVPGETDVGIADMNCETFMAKFDDQLPASASEDDASDEE